MPILASLPGGRPSTRRSSRFAGRANGADGRCVDLVLSDMAPNLSGVELADAARMEHVIELATDFATFHQNPGRRPIMPDVPKTDPAAEGDGAATP